MWLGKLCWRMGREKKQLWAQVLWKKYGNPLREEPKIGNCSHVWRSILLGWELVLIGVVWDPKDGGSDDSCLLEYAFSTNGRFKVGMAY